MKTSIIFLALIVSVSCSKNRNQKVLLTSGVSASSEQESDQIIVSESLSEEELKQLEDATEKDSIESSSKLADETQVKTATDKSKLAACPEKLAEAVNQISVERKKIDLNLDLGLGSFAKTEQSEQMSQKDLDDLVFSSTTNCEQLTKTYGATAIQCLETSDSANSIQIDTTATLEYCQAVSKICEELN